MTQEQALATNKGLWFIETKLSPPSVSRTRLVRRGSTIEALDKIHKHPVCFTIAPAGFGKTSLLAEWRGLELDRGNRVAWVSLDDSDAEFRQFLSYVILSIVNSGVPLDDLEFAARQGLVEISTDIIVPRLVSSLAKSEKPLTLILDDYHCASGGEINGVVSEIITHRSACLRVIVSSRIPPDLNRGALIASGTAFELTSERLRFSSEETHALLSDVVDEATRDEIFKQTDGWAIAVQLARLARKNGQVPYAGPVGGEHIIEYFTRQILDQSTEKERAFLLRTSILDRFSPELAAAVTGIDSIQSFVRQSRHIRSLLISLDEVSTWYRYHHLFSELLLQQLKIEKPEAVVDLHRKASRWFEEKGLVLDAVSHASQAGDTGTAARIVTDAGGWALVLYGGIGVIRSLLRNFTHEDFDRYPRLRVAYSYLLIKDGDIKNAEAQLALVDPERIEAVPDEQFYMDFHIVHSLLSGYKDEILTLESTDSLRKMIEFWSTTDQLGIGTLQACLALAEIAIGDFNAAEATASNGVMSMRQAGSVLGINYCYIHLGQCAFYRGDFELARAHFAEAASMAQDNFGADSRLQINCDIDLEALRFWQRPNELNQENLEKLLVKACETDSWFDIHASGFITLFELHRIARNHDGAAKLLQLCQATCRTRETVRLARLLPVFKLQAALTSGAEKQIFLSIDECLEGLGKGSLKDQPGLWIVHLEAACILGIAQLEKHPVGGLRDILGEAVRLAEEIGSEFYLARLLALRGALQGEHRGINAGLDDMFRAAQLAVRASIRTPFCTTHASLKYLRAVIRIGRERPERRLAVSFLTECLALKLSASRDSKDNLLSAREHDVLEELALGKSNKEIARSLDMTDHTVKFHLKNIFSKLSVDNRIAAINAGRELELI